MSDSGDPIVRTAFEVPPSLARTRPSERQPLRVGLVQERWHQDPDFHRSRLARGIELAAGEGARLVCLQELTLSKYFAVTPEGPGAPGGARPEPLDDGPTISFARRCAREFGVHVHASLFERADAEDGLGYNTAILVDPAGRLISRTRKLHIPVTAGYYEDKYFRPGPAGGPAADADRDASSAASSEDPFPVVPLALDDRADEAALGLPTCWDQWFPELARAYSLKGAEILIYPTAIGSEPDHPEFDTEPLWERVIVANGIANGTFMVAINRTGVEGPLEFYGSSFISDPYGRILVQAPRSEPAVLVADLDLDQRRDWLELFPFLTTRRPDAYGLLTRR